MVTKMILTLNQSQRCSRCRLRKQSHIDGTRYLELQIAEHFTKADGNSELYVGREGVLPGMNAWPIPHDAPYKENFDKVINAIIEAGLYNKWMKDMLDQARNEGRQKRRALQEKLKEEEDSGGIQMNDDSNSGRNVARPLTIIHLQGPLLLIIIGLGSAGVIFLFEFLIKGFYASK
ncbi:hypothetical protein SK128_028322 [Halocaridina rubra]|uniref:Uncharacterized protein n=1 Tax=Halocaridina rubra TaxID=373956 RepID=A0AAN8X1Z5_HALRR